MLGNKTVIRLSLAIIITFWVVPIYAEVTLEEYATVKNDDWFKTYLNGVGTGYSWANTDLRNKRIHDPPLPQLYCEPEKLGLNAYNYLSILDKYLSQPVGKKLLEKPKAPVELVLLYALKDAFPCK